MDALAKSTGGSKQEMAKLFPDVRALGGALALTGKNAKGAQKDLDGSRNSSGATNRALSQQSKSTAYQWQQLKANAQSLAIAVGFEGAACVERGPVARADEVRLRQHPSIARWLGLLSRSVLRSRRSSSPMP